MSPLTPVSSLSDLSQSAPSSLSHDPELVHQDDNIWSIQTDYDLSCADNKRQPAHIHDRQKNLVWTQVERLLAARADAPASIEDLERKVLFNLKPHTYSGVMLTHL